MRKIVCFALVAFVFASLIFTVSADSKRLVDDADILTDEEETQLLVLIDEASTRQNYDFVVVTVETLDFEKYTYYADAYAERLFNEHGYGVDRGGTILLISMEERDWGFYSTDLGDYTLELMGEELVPYLSEGDYYGAFAKFVERAEYDVIEASKFPYLGSIVISLGVGFIIAFIVVTIMKGKLKTVRSCDDAHEYVRKGSFDLKHSRDLYLYSTVTRVAKPKNTSTGGRGGGGGGHARGKF